MEHDHHVFMKLEDGTVWCLPDGYQVEDRSLDVIRYVLNPLYSSTQVSHHVAVATLQAFSRLGRDEDQPEQQPCCR